MSKLPGLDKLSIGCVAPPGMSVLNKTGAWRTNRPVFKHVTCIGCRACELVCPEGCVFENPGAKHTVEKLKREMPNRDFDLDYCKGCGMCAAECPVQDIDMVPEVR
ncbi:MAG: 4Fe-4S dicluster domain-containing protein [Planctomycetota bacterium]|nr:4Fe-4S dicluster domain-containing protein [Planctomycetota bacterium]